MIVQLVVDGLAAGAIYGGFALSLVLMFRSSKVVNFAHGEIGLFAAFVFWQLSASVGIWPSLLVAVLAGGLLSACMERTVIRPLGHRSHFSALVAMVAIFIGLNGLNAWIWGFHTKAMPEVFGTGRFSIGEAFVNAESVGSTVTVAICCVGVYVLLRHTRVGLMIRAASSNADSARALGIRTGRMVSISWFLAGVLGAIVAILVVSRSYLDPQAMMPILVYGFAAAVLGGVDSPLGALVGGLAIGVAENLAGSYVSAIGPDFKLVVALAAIFVMLIFRPRGIWGSPEVSRV